MATPPDEPNMSFERLMQLARIVEVDGVQMMRYESVNMLIDIIHQYRTSLQNITPVFKKLSAALQDLDGATHRRLSDSLHKHGLCIAKLTALGESHNPTDTHTHGTEATPAAHNDLQDSTS